MAFLVWGGIIDSYLKILQTNRMNLLRIILLKKSLEGSTENIYTKKKKFSMARSKKK